MTWWTKPLNIMTGVLTIGAAGSLLLATSRAVSDPEPISKKDSVISNWEQYANGGVRIGRADAPITITMFSDIRCHFCRETWGLLRRVQSSQPERIAIVYRHFPFRGLSLDPPRAGVCAARQGQMVQMYEKYIANYDSLPKDKEGLEKSLMPTDWEQLASEGGLHRLSEFRTCMLEKDIPDELIRDVQAAEGVGVVVVPTLLVNGTRSVGNPGEVKLGQLIAEATGSGGI